MSYSKQGKKMKNRQEANESRANNVHENSNNTDGEQFDDAIKAFEYFDMNHNGKVSLSELKEKLTNFGEVMSEEEVNNIFNRMGLTQNNTDEINYMDFINFLIENK